MSQSTSSVTQLKQRDIKKQYLVGQWSEKNNALLWPIDNNCSLVKYTVGKMFLLTYQYLDSVKLVKTLIYKTKRHLLWTINNIFFDYAWNILSTWANSVNITSLVGKKEIGKIRLKNVWIPEEGFNTQLLKLCSNSVRSIEC